MSVHECVPHPWDEEEGWTNCHHCFRPIRVDGKPRAQCPVVSHIGRCDLRQGHADRMHETRGVAWR